MTDPGLNQRLRQRSRRSGLMIGLSMLLTLMVCVGAFTMIYARLEPVVADFVGRGDIVMPTPLPTQPSLAAAPTVPPAPETTPDTSVSNQGGDNQRGSSTQVRTRFEPDYQVSAGRPVNLRPGPGVASGDALVAVPDASPLMYLDEEKATTNPSADDMENGQVWMKFRTEDGTEGWIRELDVDKYQP